MDLKTVCRRSLLTITAFTIVPLGVSEACSLLPRVSEKIICSAAKEISFDAKPHMLSSVPTAARRAGKSAWDIEAAPTETEDPLPEGAEIPTPKPSEEVIGALPYPSGLDDNDGEIQKTYMGNYSGEQYFDLDGGGQVRNCTYHTNEELKEYSVMGKAFEIDPSDSQPQVLIYHTHTTECYESEDKPYYDSDFGAKTTEPDKNMTAVGDAICKELEANGISVIHDTLVHDYPSYNGAYDSSRETVTQLLEEYPSVKIALDIHRDGIETADGVRLAPITEVDGREAAQIMIISGCDDGTMGMPNYLENFRFACELQSTAESMFEGLTRPVLFDYRFYNQDLTNGSLLIEVGSHGNTLDQAVYSGELIGKALSRLIIGE